MTEPVPADKCPANEALRRFRSGRLDSTARREVIEHMTSCGDCTNRLAALDGVARVPVERSRTRFIGVILAIAAAAILFLTLRIDRWFARHAMSKVTNAASTLTAWPLEGRLRGGFPDLPRLAVTRAASSAPQGRAFELEKVRNELKATVQTRRTPADLHALGLAELLLGDEDQAIVAFSDALFIETGTRDLQAAIARSSNAMLLSNAAVGLLQRARAGSSSRDAILALESAERAWTLEQTQETAWNRAVAIEALELPADAIATWEEYLRTESESSWRTTAETRLELLRRPRPWAAWDESKKTLETIARDGDSVRVYALVSAFPGRVRAQVEDELLSCWAGAVLAREDDIAGDCLHRARVIAAALQQVQRDSLLADAIRVIDGSEPRRLAEAHAAYAAARRSYREGRFAEARRGFESITSAFQDARTPFAILARAYAAACSYNLNDYDGAVDQIATLLRTTPDVARYPSVSGRARWTAGASYAFLGQFDAAFREYNAALALFRDAREHSLAVSIREMLAGTHEMMGDRDEAWSIRLATLAELAESGQSDHLQQTLAGGARAAQRHGFPALSRLLTRRELAVTREQKPSPVRAAALSRLAQLSRAGGDAAAAAHYASLAWNVVDHIAEPASRQFVLSDPNFLRGVLPQADDARRLELLRDAVSIARKTANRYATVETNLLLSREYARRGDADSAIAALTESFDDVDIQEQSIEDLAARDRIMEEYRAANRDLLYLLVQRGRVIDALLQAERNRARTVGSGALDARAIETESDLQALQRTIPADTAIVYYAALDDRMLSWLVTAEKIEFFVAPASRERVRDAADTLSVADARTFAAAVADVSRWLVAPWIDAVPPKTSTLVFVTDDETANVPFNALVAGSSMLIERFGVIVSPSVAVYTAARERDRQLGEAGAGPLLVIAAVEGREERNLEPLARGRREVDRLRARGNVRVLDDAKRSEVLAAAPSSRAIHITTHTITNEEQPSLSALVLQRERDEDGLLYVHEIAGLQLRNTRMVFIAACEAARAGSKGREGTATIGRAFLAAGAPVVIGSTRDLDDTVAAVIVDEFYRRVDAGADPVTALRQTQLSMKGRVAPVDWATLQVMGGISRERVPWLSNWK